MKIDPYPLKYTLFAFLLAMVGLVSCSGKEEVVIIETPHGGMTVILYDEAPLHKKNFLKLASSGQYDSVLFHRVIQGFMIQGGNLATGVAQKEADHLLEAEFISEKYFHEKGALAAARRGDADNPEKRSSGSQFYIVQGTTFDGEGLKKRAAHREYLLMDGYFQRLLRSENYPDLTEKWNYHLEKARNDSTYDFGTARFNLVMTSKPIIEKVFGPYNDPGYTALQQEVYRTIGGAPHLDGQYTVFGRVVEGLEVIDKIASQPTNASDRPLKDIRIHMRVETLGKKDFDRKYAPFIRK